MYAALPDDGNRYEVVQGVLIMSPAPGTPHQEIREEVYAFFREHIFLKRRGLVFPGPLDVELAPDTVVQPDVFVVLKEHLDRVQEKRVIGNPDLAVEVVSPSSATYDRMVKYRAYEQAGVPEYWLVNSRKQTIEVFVLEEGRYRSPGAFHGEQAVQSRIVPGASAAHFFDWTGGLL